MQLLSTLKILTILIVFFQLSACASQAKFEKVIQSWVGSSEKSLVQRFGVPTSVYKVEDSRFLEYLETKSGTVPGAPATYTTDCSGSNCQTTQTGGSAPMNFSTYCKTTFEVISGEIVGYSFIGPMCKI